MRFLVAPLAAISLLLSGCALSQPAATQTATGATATPGAAASSAAATSATPGRAASASPAPSASAASSASPSSASASPTGSAPPAAEKAEPQPDKRKGKQLNTPYQVNGIVVVSKKHRITAGYAPRNPSGPYRLEAAAAKALARMTAAAKADGVRIRVRSGYRNWATQNAIYLKAKRNYPQNIDYYAPAGASEHQTGLAVDLWDGTTWSLPMARSAAGKWLFKHAHAYGFVLRYPDGKKQITGYHYEPWHYRYLGVADATKFGKSNALTLEEYLGLA